MSAVMEMQPVPFPATGETIFAGRLDGQVYVAVKPICEKLGVVWQPQHRKLAAHPVLSKGITIMVIPSASGHQETVCLPLELLPGWLFTINVNKVAAHLRDKVLAYQVLCFKVLHEHFLGAAPGASDAGVAAEAAAIVDMADSGADGDLDTLLADGDRLGRALALVREARMIWPRGWVQQIWRDAGLPVPPETREVQAVDAGSLAAFLEAEVVPSPGNRLRYHVLHRRYLGWCREQQEQPVTDHVMGRVLAACYERGNSNGRYYRDVRLRG